jgi:molecular chaperone DnaK
VEAREGAPQFPHRTFTSVKRFMGRAPADCRADAELFRYTMDEGETRFVRFVCEGREPVTPVEVSAEVLRALKLRAVECLFGEPGGAVITVPAYFDDAQRQATKDAARLAGIEVLRLLNEPTAAAIAYGAVSTGKKTVAVYDLGGGTFDVSVVRVAGTGEFEVLATGGDTMLGGEDFDAALMLWLLQWAKDSLGVSLKDDRQALQRLKEASELAKCALSAQNDYDFLLQHLATGKKGEPLHLARKITRDSFASLVKPLIEKTIVVCDEVVFQSGVQKEKLDDLLLVGGSSRVPAVQAAVSKYFGRPPSQRVNPDEAVAIGAAMHAESLSGKTTTAGTVKLKDVTPQTLGILTEGVKLHPIIARNTKVPAKKTVTFGSRAGQKNVDLVVMQGDEKDARKNAMLGRFRMWGLSSAKGGPAQLDVTFAIDEDGIVHVAAKDRASGQEQSIRVTASSGLTREEIVAAKTGPKKTKPAKKESRPSMSAVKTRESSAKHAAVKRESSAKHEAVTPEKRSKTPPPVEKKKKGPPPIPNPDVSFAEDPADMTDPDLSAFLPLPDGPVIQPAKKAFPPPEGPVAKPSAEVVSAIMRVEAVCDDFEKALGETAEGRALVTKARDALQRALDRAHVAKEKDKILADLDKTEQMLRDIV